MKFPRRRESRRSSALNRARVTSGWLSTRVLGGPESVRVFPAPSKVFLHGTGGVNVKCARRVVLNSSTGSWRVCDDDESDHSVAIE